MTDRAGIDTIKQGLIDRLPELLAELAPGMKRHGAYFQGPNPTRIKDSRTSFTVWSNGAFKEYDDPSNPNANGDVIGLVAYCRQCTNGDAIKWARDWLGLGSMSREERGRLDQLAATRATRQKESDEAERQRKVKSAFEIWLQAKPLAAGGVVDRYLKGRAIDLDEADSLTGDLRQHDQLRYWGPRPDDAFRHVGPAMVAPIRQLSGEILGVHATFLKADGTGKAPLINPKLMLGQKQGGAVRLSRGKSGLAFEDLTEPEDLILCEGIETGLALAVALDEVRVWAALDLGNMAALPFTPKVARLFWALEHDVKPAAIEARERGMAALKDKGFDVCPFAPPWGGDFNDTLKD